MSDEKRLLIAGRGEIALRIARSAVELGWQPFALCSEDDELPPALAAIAERVALPGSGAAAYLSDQRILELAREHQCSAIHPGYGFLSERAHFARRCEEAGVGFVGPSAAVLALLGDKSRSRELAISIDVPVPRGTEGLVSLREVSDFLESLPEGRGLLLKACAGGGGRGIRAVHERSELDEIYSRCRSEAFSAFGSDSLYAEELLEGVRHLEVQIVGDAEGGITHLWERDCTIQRRHQKLIEVAPAPNLDESLRAQLLEASIALGEAADIRGVGTFEFLVDAAGAFYFIEANPRLQVEHTVTEEVTGIDLVAAQLRIHEGETLGDLGLEVPPRPRGFAIELRVNAETLGSDGEVVPGGGALTAFETPTGPGIRVDTAAHVGFVPNPAFDSLLAKLVVRAPAGGWAACLARAERALTEFRIEGSATNLNLLRVLLARPELAGSDVTVDFVSEHAAELAEAAAALAQPTADATLESSTLEMEIPEGMEAIVAPMTASVIDLLVEVDDTVAPGDVIAVVEAMKMEHLIAVPTAGWVRRVFVEEGDIVDAGQPLVIFEATASGAPRANFGPAVDLQAIRPDLHELFDRRGALLDARRPKAVERRRSREQRTARENLAALCDEDSFIEYGAFAVAAQRRLREIDDLIERTSGDGILTGLGTINADLFGSEAARCAILVADATVLAATQGYFHHKKIDRLLDLAARHQLPVVFFPEGGGGRPNDVDVGDVMSAQLTVDSFRAFARLSGVVPRVSVVSGYCFAGSAAFAGCADVIIATENSYLGMGGPAMIEGGGLGSFAPEAIGPIEVQAPNGVVDLVVADEVEGAEAAKRYLSYFQGRVDSWSCADQRQLRHAVPDNRRRAYDLRRVVHALCDEDSVFELRRDFGIGMITALVRIEGQPFGLIANNPLHLGGAIDSAAADKGARFLQLCDAFGLPVISLCDTPGFMVGPEVERDAQVRKVSRLFVVGAGLSVPVFTVILRKAYGLGAQAMAGGSFHAPVFTVAWPTGEIGGMGLEGAVRLGMKQKLDEIKDPKARSRAFDDAVAKLYEKGKALNSAMLLEFDAVIDPLETRAWILRARNAAGPIARGSKRFVDTW